MSLPLSIEVPMLRFTLGLLRSEIQQEEAHFNHLDRLYSEFFFLQNDHVRFLHRIGDLTREERNRQWSEIDEQEKEWEARLSDWREERFRLRELISQLQARMKELNTREIARVAA